MGDPKQLRKKYNTPRHPWIRATIESERVVVKDYGLVKKKEIHQANSFLKKYKANIYKAAPNGSERILTIFEKNAF